MVSERLRAAVHQFVRPDFFFVNIGAGDGVSNDPIYPFIRELGWRGIVVEPVQHIFEELKANYRDLDGIVFERTAIASAPRLFHYLAPAVGGAYPWTKQVGSLNRSNVLNAIHQMREHQYLGPVPHDLERHVRSERVPCMTFDALMRKHEVGRIDFLNIDAEGADFEIFCSIDLTRYRPAILCIETCPMAEHERSALKGRLAEAKYEFLEVFDIFSEVYVQRRGP